MKQKSCANLTNMKILLTFFVLFFSSSVFADDISDFEIRGMSIGDSLLDHYSRNEIINFKNLDHLPSDMKFRNAYFYDSKPKIDNYDMILVSYKPEDNNFIIYELTGVVNCFSKQECKKLFNDMLNDISKVFNNSQRLGGETLTSPDDPSGKSKHTSYIYELNRGLIWIQYQDWIADSGFQTNVRIGISTNEVDDWINSNWGLN